LKPNTTSLGIRKAYQGIFLYRMKPLIFGAVSSLNTSIFISNVARPFRMELSSFITLNSVTVDNTQFDYTGFFQPPFQLDTLPNFGLITALNSSALKVTNNTSIHSLRSNSVSSFPFAGIYTNDVGNVEITGVKVDELLDGIYTAKSNFATANDNNFFTRRRGIVLYDTKSTKVERNSIAHTLTQFQTPSNVFSTLPINYNFGSQGIVLGETVVPTSNGIVGFNQIKMNRVSVVAKEFKSNYAQAISTGALLWNKRGISVTENTFLLQNDDPLLLEPRFYGIYKSNGLDNRICANDVIGLQGFDRGIGSFMSKDFISCNKVEFTKQALYMEGDNENPNSITSNEFSSSQYGIYVNNTDNMQSALGTQRRQENKWPSIWNQGGYWNGNPFGTQFSQFFNFPLYPWFPNTVYPSGDIWFVDQSAPGTPVPDCPDPGILSLTCPINQQINSPDGELGTLAKRSSELKEPYKSMVLRREYDRIIDAYPTIETAPTDLYQFVKQLKESAIARLSAVDHLLARPLVNNLDLENSQNQLSQTLQTALPEVQQYYNWLYNLNAEAYKQYVALGQVAPMVQQFEQLNDELGKVRIDIALITEQAYATASAINQSIPEEDQYVALEKQMNALIITSLKETPEHEVFTATEWESIHEIAGRCPQDWGDGVLKARGLWLKYGGAYELKWQECFPTHEKSNGSEDRSILQDAHHTLLNNAKSGIVLYPIPVTDDFKLQTSEEYMGSQYEIVNLTGVIVQTGSIATEIQSFNVENLSNGIHFIQIRAFNKRPVTLKFVVQKL
jgi:Secretion system C-terminal sorting domain